MLTEKKKRELGNKFLAALEKSMSPSKSIHRLSSQFISWCREKKLNPKQQTMSGDNFKKFLGEKKKLCRQAMQRARKLIFLYKFESPMPIGSESAYECFSDIGWNDCVRAVIRGGQLPARIENKEGGAGGKVGDERRLERGY